ncbi:mercury methylation corrinoid protein HgcA [Desulfolutivibrio sulfodismutans]|nr:mercury methylation corrinoid protein HgcA [Desulfolutivibrio sulfodismutans]
MMPLTGKKRTTAAADPCCCSDAPGRGDAAASSCCDGSASGGEDSGQPCCGGPQAPAASPMARPGYELHPFVETFRTTLAGPVPVVRTSLDRRDFRGTLGARLGYGRDGYRVAPGLYAVGRPGPDSPVLVTADYKLSFDALRRELSGIDAWILVLDTRGINVWCAAGKGTFSAAAVARLVEASGLARVVSHRRLIVPQLAAPGLDARDVRRRCGFTVMFGPVRAADLPAFLRAGNRAEPAMRRVTFTLSERLAVAPVEVYHARKWLWWAALAALAVSGIGPGVFSLAAVWERGVWLVAAILAGLVGGALVVPVFLPWLPGRAFAFKGAIAAGGLGLLTVLAQAAWAPAAVSSAGRLAMVLVAGSLGSYLAMNFTGSTPFASPSGVEREMRRAMPLQAVGLVIAAILWIISAF